MGTINVWPFETGKESRNARANLLCARMGRSSSQKIQGGVTALANRELFPKKSNTQLPNRACVLFSKCRDHILREHFHAGTDVVWRESRKSHATNQMCYPSATHIVSDHFANIGRGANHRRPRMEYSCPPDRHRVCHSLPRTISHSNSPCNATTGLPSPTLAHGFVRRRSTSTERCYIRVDCDPLPVGSRRSIQPSAVVRLPGNETPF